MDSNPTSRFSDILVSCTSFLPRFIWALCGRPSSPDLSLLDQSLRVTRDECSSSSQHSHNTQKSLRVTRDECSSSSQHSHNSQSYTYDVFISFRGSDTRNTFVDHLYNHLIRKGIFAFKDDKQLDKGESISPQLLQAIQNSRVSIIVFSKDYASSTWCLNEMVAIYECQWKNEQKVLPVFIDVDPSHVRNFNGVYEDAFVSHSKYFINELHKVSRWKHAMRHLAGLAGWDVRNKPEFKEIENIVRTVIKALGHKFSGYANDLIGIQPRVEALQILLNLKSEDDGFRVLGICGMGGIGKTTLAKVLYDTITYQFGACCFIEDVRKTYKDGGAIAVQKHILLQTIKEKDLETLRPSQISGIIIDRLSNIKLLIVLDDVDDFEHLEKLDINPKSLCIGSRIIITTRDDHILKQYGAHTIYKVELMNDIDAHDLLCRNAFKSDYSSSIFAELISEVLQYVQGLPLAITIMGSFLCGRDSLQWRATLDELRDDPDTRIMKVLQMSFDGLKPSSKEIFLHIACFFKGEREDYVRRILDACGLYPNIGIPLLVEKSLITLGNQVIYMHDLLQELGKKIVQGQPLREPRFWSRLWLYKDFRHVMTRRNEMNALEFVKAIVLDPKEDGLEFDKLSVKKLSKMENLKLLILYQKNFSGTPIFASDSLCYFSWNGYPFTSLPSNFQPHDLVELNMSDSNIEHLWKGVQYLPCLKRMDLSNSKNLKITPSFEGMQNLERLDLTGCINLSEMHPSINRLTKLVFLSLQNCSSLVNLNFSNDSRLNSLKVLRLFGCTKLEYTPNFVGVLNLEYLDMERCTSLFIIHESIGDLTKLKFLSLKDCTSLVKMPGSLNDMKYLMTLDLNGCFNFKYLPIYSNSAIESLICLDLSFCSISNVPDAIGELRYLERLNLQGNNFTTLPWSIERLYHLAYLNLSHCHSLQYLPVLPTESGQSDSMGRYFKTMSESRHHRSGL